MPGIQRVARKEIIRRPSRIISFRATLCIPGQPRGRHARKRSKLKYEYRRWRQCGDGSRIGRHWHATHRNRPRQQLREQNHRAPVNVELSSVNALSYYSKQISGSRGAARWRIEIPSPQKNRPPTPFVLEPYWSDGRGGPEPIPFQAYRIGGKSHSIPMPRSSRTVNAGGAWLPRQEPEGPPFFSLAAARNQL